MVDDDTIDMPKASRRKIDFDRVKTFDDMKDIIEAMHLGLGITYQDAGGSDFDKVRHLFRRDD